MRRIHQERRICVDLKAGRSRRRLGSTCAPVARLSTATVQPRRYDEGLLDINAFVINVALLGLADNQAQFFYWVVRVRRGLLNEMLIIPPAASGAATERDATLATLSAKKRRICNHFGEDHRLFHGTDWLSHDHEAGPAKLYHGEFGAYLRRDLGCLSSRKASLADERQEKANFNALLGDGDFVIRTVRLLTDKRPMDIVASSNIQRGLNEGTKHASLLAMVCWCCGSHVCRVRGLVIFRQRSYAKTVEAVTLGGRLRT